MTEDQLATTFFKMQRFLAPDISIEVGAYNADFSRSMAGLVKKAYAFEASPYVYNSYKDNIPPGVEYINKAVSNYTGITQFEIQERFEPSVAANNTIKKRNERTRYSYIDIQTVSLDDYFKDIDGNISLWIDCEGAAEEVLLGAKDTLKRVDSLHIEVETLDFWKDQWLYEDISKFLAGEGFKELSSANIDLQGHQKNIIYLKQR